MKSTLILMIISHVIGHSWLDCISKPETTYTKHEQIFGNDFYEDVCIGFPRSYPGRDHHDIGTLYTVAVLNRGTFPEGATPATTSVCSTSNTQLQANPSYTSQFPMTKVKAGSSLKLWYEMDGHIDRPTEYNVYAASEPGEQIHNYEQMKNSDLLLKATFADSNICSNIGNTNTLCWGTFQVPEKWRPGVYSLVWNWPWDQNSAGDEYNTCFEIEVTE